MPSRSDKLFPKPTAIAILAAILGLVVHGAVFFLIRIDMETPIDFIPAEEKFSYLGVSDPTTVALLDPLTLLVRSDQQDLDTGLKDFRSLSISREISPFPPFFTIEKNREWAAWIPPEVTEQNPGSWLLERAESSLQNFGIVGLAPIRLPADQMTLRAIDLTAGESYSLNQPLPESVRESSRAASFLSPATFLLDRTDAWSRPYALLVESSGNAAVDEALRETLSGPDSGFTRDNGYSLVTYFLPPAPDEEPAP